MNKELIFKIVKPHLNSKKELTYYDFDNLFSSLENQEKYAVCDLLVESGIELVDEKSVDDICTINFKLETSENKHKIIIIKKENLNSQSISINKKKNTKKSINKYIYETNEYLVELYQRTKKDEVLTTLINKNRKYIIKKANQASYYYNHNLSEEDLYQIATMGFICGCKKFDTTKGYNLLTYATFWINQILRREIMDTGFLIRLPVHKWETINKINKIMARYSSDDDIDSILKNKGFSPKIIADVMNLKSNYLNPEFLDSYAFNDSDITILDTVSENANCFISEIPSPTKKITSELLREDMVEMLCTLSPRERDVLRLRFGMDDGRQRTLEEVGNLFGVTRERIRQIEAKALRKLRHPNRSKRLREYVDFTVIDTLEVDAKYLFKNKMGASYIPEISEIIKRILKLFPDETNIDVLYDRICNCASQNSYKVSSLSKDNIMCKLEKYIKKMSS